MDLTVRLNCILMLTVLILHEQIKMKDHSVDLAKCILPERMSGEPNDERVVGLARHFFAEFSSKASPGWFIYYKDFFFFGCFFVLFTAFFEQ